MVRKKLYPCILAATGAIQNPGIFATRFYHNFKEDNTYLYSENSALYIFYTAFINHLPKNKNKIDYNDHLM